MPESADSRPVAPVLVGTADLSPHLPTSEHGAVNPSRHPFWDGDVVEATPQEWEIIHELRWAYEQEASGAFLAHVGKYLAIVNRAVQAVGGDPERIINEASRKTGVPPGRVALFHVERVD